MADRQSSDRNYDAWLHWQLPCQCSLSCAYCYNLPLKNDPAAALRHIFPWIKKEAIAISRGKFPEAINRVRLYIKKSKGKAVKASGTIDVAALLIALKKTGKIFRVSLTGRGEPFLADNIVEACRQITKKHYLSLNTNLISGKIGEFCEKIDPQKVVAIEASLHIKELERLGLTDIFIRNFLLCQEKGFKISAKEVAYPPLLEEIEKYKGFFQKNGIKLSFTGFNGYYNRKEYPAAYTQREVEIFGLENAPDFQMFNSRGKICNAGYNAIVVYENGDVAPCWSAQDNLGSIYNSFKLKDKLFACPQEHCVCPLSAYDSYLFEKALKENFSDAARQA
ncbi:MAG: hypothetical protein WC532_04495 [Candidatus Omnitrophota bacterium]